MQKRFCFLLTGLLMLFALAPGVRAQAQADPALRLALQGYDTVAYFTDGKPTPGDPQFETVFDGVRYRFASAEHMKQFTADPDTYAPQFAGACAYALTKGIKVEADPTLWRIIDGRLYVFGVAKVLPEVDANPEAVIAKASDNNKALADQPFKVR